MVRSKSSKIKKPLKQRDEVRIPVPGIAATDPHELPRNSDGVAGSQRGGTLAAAAPGISLPGFAAAFLDILKSYKASPRRIALKSHCDYFSYIPHFDILSSDLILK